MDGLLFERGIINLIIMSLDPAQSICITLVDLLMNVRVLCGCDISRLMITALEQ